jgi:oligopeptidase A
MQSPLLSVAHPLPFNAIRADEVVSALSALVADARAKLQEIASDSSPVSFANCLGALEAATEPLEIASSVVEHLESVMTTPELRKAYNESLPITTAFWTQIPLDAGLYRRIRELGTRSSELPLTDVERRLLEKTLEEFKRHGAELNAAGKAELSAIDEELSRITAQFSQNVVDATGAWELVLPEASRLAGLPETAVDMIKESAKAKGLSGYRLTLQTPTVIAVLTYADDRALRELIWRANDQRCSAAPYDNATLIARILELRLQKAKLLGYQNFGDLVMADRMAKCSAEARRFIDELTERTRTAFDRECHDLQAFVDELEGPSKLTLMPWDTGYYAEKLRKQRYSFDEEELRAYFPAEQMLEAVFQTTSELFGIRIEPLSGIQTWADSVRVYAIYDQTGPQLGVFYVDWYPRENKNQGAWMHGLITGSPNVAVIAANASPPTEERPSLLTHRDVETLWHEFGHLLHHCLSRVPLRSLSGTRVAHDFVELPSQIMENFCWEPLMLKRFARHYVTGESIPDELIERMRATRTYRAASAQMRQLGFASLDLALHCDYSPERDGSVLEFARKIQASFAPAPLPDDYAMVTTFSHLFAHPVGYATGYYSYKWAEVLDADAYGRFAEAGVMNETVGHDYRTKVLEVGDSRDPAKVFEDFRGRPPETSALLRRLGLLSTDK